MVVNTRQHVKIVQTSWFLAVVHRFSNEEINDLPQGASIERDGYIHVKAQSVDDNQIKFVCPFCWSAYKKDGSPTARAKRVVHQNGSGGDKTQRVVLKGSHCGDANKKSFSIYVTDDTIGALKVEISN